MIINEPLVYIIVLNYNGLNDTIECIESIKKIKYCNYKIVIVDNNSVDGSNKILKELFSECIHIQNPCNAGYAVGNNLGIKYAKEKNADYVCILNNDTVVEENFLNELIKYMEVDKNTTFIGPLILEYSNENIIQSTGADINLYKGKVPPKNSGKPLKDLDQEIIECDYVGGACILMRMGHLDKIGYIPDNYFLFYEETEWCLKAKNNNYKVVCNCNAIIKHKGSASIDKISGLSYYYMNRNRIIFEKRNSSKLQWLFFCNYLIIESLYKIITRKSNLKILKYYIDGFLNKTDESFKLSKEKKDIKL